MGDAVTIAIELQAEIFVDQSLRRVPVIVKDHRQRAQGIGPEAVDGSLPGLLMEAHVGDFSLPLSRLAVHIVQVGELAQRPEILAHVSDAAAFHLSFFPATSLIAGPRDKVVFAGEGQETRMEAHQAAIMFGYGRGQIVIENFPAHTVKSRKGMDVATHEGFKTLAVGELQIRHPAMPIDHREGIQLALVAFVAESAEVAPVHLEAIPGLWDPYARRRAGAATAAAPGGYIRAGWSGHRYSRGAAGAVMTAALARASFSSSSAMVGLKGSSLLVRDRAAGVCAGASKYFLTIRQLMPRCCSILRMGQCSTQYR
jgi:hypothetical protein